MITTWPAGADLPAVTAGQMREIDRIMVEDLHISLEQMMENAGRGLAEVALACFDPRSATILTGPGGNGGGGLVAARHLANRGVAVTITPTIGTPATAPAHQLDIATRMGIPISDQPQPADLVIDALIGYSLRGAPHGRTAELIGWANRSRRPVLALDLPSGLDATTGRPATPCITADVTMTLALPKVGLNAAEATGQLYLADIGVPAAAYGRLGMSVPALFRGSSIVALPPGIRLAPSEQTSGS